MMQMNLGEHETFRQMHQFVARGEYAGALQLAKKLIKAKPSDPMYLLYLSMAQRGLGQNHDAKQSLDKVLKLQPRNHAAWNDLALTNAKMGRWPEARKAIDRASEIVPEDATIGAAKADLCYSMGDFDECGRVLDRFAALGIESPMLAIAHSKMATRRGRESEAVDRLRRALQKFDMPPAVASGVYFHLAGMLDKQGDTGAAFDAYAAGNASRGVQFDIRENFERASRLIAAWPADFAKRLPRAKIDGSRAVFIVGMPRSATSLIEQILSSHPKVAGAGELNDIPRAVHSLVLSQTHLVPMMHEPHLLTQSVVDRIAKEYFATMREISPVATRVTDKMPLNFLHLGLIRQVLPGARIIHSIRNPVDTCWSCFTQNFGGNNPFAYDLRHLGAFYRTYRSVMDHWKRTVDLPMLDVVYEDVLADPEAHVRRMLDFLGLEWDDRCMKFHENKRVVLTASQDQVRQKLFTTSKGRWRRYEKHLGPLLESLGEYAPSAQ